MAEFEILINQSLVEKTLNNLKYDPLELIHYKKTSFLEDKENFVIPEGDDLIDVDYSKEDYFENGLDIIKDDYMKDEDNLDFSLQPEFLSEMNTSGNPSINFEEEIVKDENIIYQEKSDSISFVADFLSSYVITHPTEFEEGTVELAENIFNRDSQYSLQEKFLGFGNFFKKVFRAGKRILKKMGRWVLNQIKKVVGIGKPELHELRLVQYGKPYLKLSNPIRIKRINAQVDKLKIKVPYYIKFPWQSIKWRYITITINNKIGAKVDGDLHFSSRKLKIFTNLKLNSFIVNVNILGTKFSIGLTGIANSILIKKEFEIYDATSIATPIQVKGLSYSISELAPVGLSNGLRLDLNIDVSKS